MKPAERNHGNKVSWDVLKLESTNGSFKQVSRLAEHNYGLNDVTGKVRGKKEVQ